jgi:FMN-dependent NADH-azoreductase
MSSVLLLNASPAGAASRGFALADEAVANLRWNDGNIAVVSRDLTAEPLAPVSFDYASAIVGGQPFDAPAFDQSERLIREIEASDYLVIATPMHNFTVPAALKLWIDNVLRHSRSFAPSPEGKLGLLGDRPVLVIVSSGDRVMGDSVRQPDHLTGYLTDVLATLGMTDVRFVYLEGVMRPDLTEQVMAAGRAAIDRDTAFGVLRAA